MFSPWLWEEEEVESEEDAKTGKHLSEKQRRAYVSPRHSWNGDRSHTCQCELIHVYCVNIFVYEVRERQKVAKQ